MLGRGVGWPLGVAVGLLVFVGVAASVTHYLQEPYNPGFLPFPTVVALHVVLGGVYLALAPFQFVKRIRSRHLGYHRKARRLLVAVGLVVGVTALFMGLLIPFSGWPERVIIGLFGGLFLVSLVKGFVYVRARQGEPAPGVDDPGVRHSAVCRHNAADLHPRDDHRVHTKGLADRRAAGDVLYGGTKEGDYL